MLNLILGSLYAQGMRVKQDFKEAAYWFRQAELSGDEQAEELCLKCSLDFIHQNFDIKNSEQLYTDMFDFIKYVYSSTNGINLEVCRTFMPLPEIMLLTLHTANVGGFMRPYKYTDYAYLSRILIFSKAEPNCPYPVTRRLQATFFHCYRLSLDLPYISFYPSRFT